MHKEAKEFIKEQIKHETNVFKRRTANKTYQKRTDSDANTNAFRRHREKWIHEQETIKALKDFGFNS